MREFPHRLPYDDSDGRQGQDDRTLYPPRESHAAQPPASAPLPPSLPPLQPQHQRAYDQITAVTPTVRVRRPTEEIPAARTRQGSAQAPLSGSGPDGRGVRPTIRAATRTVSHTAAPRLRSPAAPPAVRRLGWGGPRGRRLPGVDTSSPRRWKTYRKYALIFALVALVLVSGLMVHRLLDFGTTISSQGPFATQTGYMTGPDRVNVVILSYGGAGHDGAYLTDSMMAMSVIPSTGSTTMISVPRDLWVQVPPNSGQYAKINSAYQDGVNNGYRGMSPGANAGGAEAASKVSDVLGLSVPFWISIDFSGFRSLVDALGGVDVTVPVGFTAQYPINDDPTINAGWKTITFKAGPQHMNGEQAIEYARARYVTSPLSQASDFARSQRQTLLIRAIVSRARSVRAMPGMLSALSALQNTVRTNLSLSDLALFAQRMDMSGAARVGLSDQNVLVDAVSGDGQDILEPAHGDWGAIAQYVAANLKS